MHSHHKPFKKSSFGDNEEKFSAHNQEKVKKTTHFNTFPPCSSKKKPHQKRVKTIAGDNPMLLALSYRETLKIKESPRAKGSPSQVKKKSAFNQSDAVQVLDSRRKIT